MDRVSIIYDFSTVNKHKYFVTAITVIFYNVIFAIAMIEAASKIHKYLLENTLRLPTHFFDTTPIGRILARFSSDLNSVDGMLPMTFQMVLNNALRVSDLSLFIYLLSYILYPYVFL